jgi:hypothetical protein
MKLSSLTASSAERRGRGEGGEPGLYRGRHWWLVKVPVTPGSNRRRALLGVKRGERFLGEG